MYRLKHYEEAYELGIDEAFYGAVNLIEWPEKIKPLLPKKAWNITINTQGTTRLFEITASNDEQFNRLKEVVFE
jgi:tRNA threonylcarbamoyladenosine biosynthesis protein TsaE